MKKDSLTGELLSGADFRITTLSGEPVDDNEGQTSSGGIYTTDENGHISITKIQPGTYIITEIKAPSGYVLNTAPQTVTVHENDAQTVTFRNVPKQTLIIQKYESGSTNPITGVTFHVTDQNGTSNGDFVTDQNGQVILHNLTPGTVITAMETQTASGYVPDSTPQSIVIRSGDVQTMVFYNSRKGSLTVNKIDSLTERPLADAEFKITTIQGEPVDDNEGRTSTSGIYKTDSSGQIILANLQPGIYTVTETKAPDGYVLNVAPQTVTVRENDAQSLVFRNVPLQNLVIQKYADGTQTPLSGVTFLITDIDGKRIGNGEYITDENGQIILDGLEPGLTVIAREIRTVEGYHLNETPQTIRIATNVRKFPHIL